MFMYFQLNASSNGPCNRNDIGCVIAWEKEMVGIGAASGYLDDEALELYELRSFGLMFIHIDFFLGLPLFFLLATFCPCSPHQVGHIHTHCPFPVPIYKG